MAVLFQSDLFSINDDPVLLDEKTIHKFMVEGTYWAQNRTLEQVIKTIRYSYCLGAYSPSGEQIGFARVVTDWTTFGWVCDVFVVKQARGLGIGKQLVTSIMDHPDLKNIRRLMLVTQDAHELYRPFGFIVEDDPQTLMKRLTPS